jgi:erythromycin esterase-like protein
MRDGHMFKTLENISDHFEKRLGRKPRIVVWAHNSHLGNAEATDMKARGDINLGQLVKEKYKEECLSIGFSTSRGTVTAASAWDGPAQIKTVRNPLSGSYESLFSEMKEKSFFIDLRHENDAITWLRWKRLQRAIGVIYLPETERQSHYFYASLPHQFDFIIHIDQTTALEALPAFVHQRPGELDETYPYGL